MKEEPKPEPTEELKPCPVCGSKAQEATDIEGLPLGYYECTECNFALDGDSEKDWNECFAWQEVYRIDLARRQAEEERDVWKKVAKEANENSKDHIYGEKWFDDIEAEAARILAERKEKKSKP